jgi:glycosyltransferase involved in cell wall biosynthesis
MTLVQEEMSAGILAYPSTFEELFCISCAEAMVAGCLPITSECGALPTTNMYRTLPGDANNPEWQKTFAAILSEELENPDEAMRKQIQQRAMARFNPDRIISLWKEKILK